MKALLILFLSVNALASIEQAPMNFSIDNKKAVFVDFLRAKYNIVYQAKMAFAKVTSLIEFDMPSSGHPLFDSVSKPISLKIDGEFVDHSLITMPGNASQMRMVEKVLSPGTHTLEIVTPIERGTYFENTTGDWGRVSSGFFIRDLSDRTFLEKYLPSNLEYDQYQMDLDVKVEGTKRWHSLFSNGVVTKINDNHFHVSMPKWYTTSSVFFHLVPINKFVRWYLEYPSIDGRKIPITIYSHFRFYNYYAKKKAWKVLQELEQDYGPFPHDKLVIYGTGIKGGMELAGAVETSIISLGHELQHQYFAKCIHPANGNSGWLDEAIASWRDKGHKTYSRPFYLSANLASHSAYTRKTDKKSYKYGRSFMAYIDHVLKDIGRPGLKDFLRHYFNKRKYTTVTTETFKHDLEDYANMSFAEDFNQYIYGGINSKEILEESESFENPHHPILTEEEFRAKI